MADKVQAGTHEYVTSKGDKAHNIIVIQEIPKSIKGN